MPDIVMRNGDRIVVEAWDAASAYRLQNLARLTSFGATVWRAHLPENGGPDCFVSAKEEDGLLVGTTWSGQSLVLDPETGECLRSTFVK